MTTRRGRGGWRGCVCVGVCGCVGVCVCGAADDGEEGPMGGGVGEVGCEATVEERTRRHRVDRVECDPVPEIELLWKRRREAADRGSSWQKRRLRVSADDWEQDAIFAAARKSQERIEESIRSRREADAWAEAAATVTSLAAAAPRSTSPSPPQRPPGVEVTASALRSPSASTSAARAATVTTTRLAATPPQSPSAQASSSPPRRPPGIAMTATAPRSPAAQTSTTRTDADTRGDHGSTITGDIVHPSSGCHGTLAVPADVTLGTTDRTPAGATTTADQAATRPTSSVDLRGLMRDSLTAQIAGAAPAATPSAATSAATRTWSQELLQERQAHRTWDVVGQACVCCSPRCPACATRINARRSTALVNCVSSAAKFVGGIRKHPQVRGIPGGGQRRVTFSDKPRVSMVPARDVHPLQQGRGVGSIGVVSVASVRMLVFVTVLYRRVVRV